MYYIIPSEHFILFLKEAELRRNINSFSNEKNEEICNILNYVRDVDLENLYSEDYLNQLTET